MKKKCTACGRIYYSDAEYCEGCGAELKPYSNGFVTALRIIASVIVCFIILGMVSALDAVIAVRSIFADEELLVGMSEIITENGYTDYSYYPGYEQPQPQAPSGITVYSMSSPFDFYPESGSFAFGDGEYYPGQYGDLTAADVLGLVVPALNGVIVILAVITIAFLCLIALINWNWLSVLLYGGVTTAYNGLLLTVGGALAGTMLPVISTAIMLSETDYADISIKVISKLFSAVTTTGIVTTVVGIIMIAVFSIVKTKQKKNEKKGKGLPTPPPVIVPVEPTETNKSDDTEQQN